MKGFPGRLRALIPGSIAARGMVLIVLVTGSVAVPAWSLHRALADRERRRNQYGSETFLAVALTAYLENATSAGAERDVWLQTRVLPGSARNVGGRV